MTTEQKLARLIGDTIVKHRMIEQNDRILVAFSGGKDSYTLLDILLRLQKHSPVKFGLLVAIVDSGFGADYAKAEKYLKSSGIGHIIQKTNIEGIVRKKIPRKDTGKYCSLCSMLRRGILYTLAKKHKCNKIALGHNLNDSIETFLLNIFYTSRTDIMRPSYLAEDKQTTIIRPLINVPEELIRLYSQEKAFLIINQKCLFRKEDSKRAQIKELIKELSKDNPYLYSSLTNVIERQ